MNARKRAGNAGQYPGCFKRLVIVVLGAEMTTIPCLATYLQISETTLRRWDKAAYTNGHPSGPELPPLPISDVLEILRLLIVAIRCLAEDHEGRLQEWRRELDRREEEEHLARGGYTDFVDPDW